MVKNSSPFFSKLVRVRDSNFYTFERYHKALSLLLLVLFAQIFSWQNIGRAVSHGESRVIKLTICQQMIDSKECVPKKWDLFVWVYQRGYEIATTQALSFSFFSPFSTTVVSMQRCPSWVSQSPTSFPIYPHLWCDSKVISICLVYGTFS